MSATTIGLTHWVALVLLAGCGQAHTDELTKRSAELTDSLNLLSESADFNGFGAAIVGPEGVLYQGGFGFADVVERRPYTANTVQPIASISKTFIGIAVMKAQELGKLRLDDPISMYLPFPVVNPHHPNVAITLRQLVTHTSSILDTRDYLFRAWVLDDTVDLANALRIDISPCRFSPPSAAMSMEAFLHDYLAPDGAWHSDSAFGDFRPGTRFNYSNVGATLAAMVVERATGMPFDAFTQQYILTPLGMNSSTWHEKQITDSAMSRLYHTRTDAYPRYSLITWPDGGMTTSSSDMAKYMVELVKGYRGEGTLLGKEAYAEYFREQLSDSDFVDRASGKYTDEHNIGITIGFSSEGYFGHTGGDPGVFSMFFVDRKTGLGVYLIINTDIANYDHHIPIWNLLDRYAELLNKAG